MLRSAAGAAVLISEMREQASKAPSSDSRLGLLLPALAYTALVFVVGSLPAAAGPPSVSDKTLHLLAFVPFSPLSERAVRAFRPGLPARLRYFLAFALASGCGGLLELWQAALPHRSCDLLDWVADTAGAALGAALAFALGSARQRHRAP